MSDLLHLPPGLAWLAIAACFGAGMIRGFAGFGLSAMAMAILASFIPPIQLIPAFWFLEMAASLILMKGGWADADRRTAITLVLGAGAALPLGLWFSLSIDPVVSQQIALTLLVALALGQLTRARLAFLATLPGTVGTGLAAGLITGLAGAGGMFIALYTLARNLPARQMRGTLNIYLLGGGILGLTVHLFMGTINTETATRGMVLIVPTLFGVFAGKALFNPRWEHLYKPVCLTLLIGLAVIGLIRLVLQ